jgi:hypothetical protein
MLIVDVSEVKFKSEAAKIVKGVTTIWQYKDNKIQNFKGFKRMSV